MSGERLFPLGADNLAGNSNLLRAVLARGQFKLYDPSQTLEKGPRWEGLGFALGAHGPLSRKRWGHLQRQLHWQGQRFFISGHSGFPSWTDRGSGAASGNSHWIHTGSGACRFATLAEKRYFVSFLRELSDNATQADCYGFRRARGRAGDNDSWFRGISATMDSYSTVQSGGDRCFGVQWQTTVYICRLQELRPVCRKLNGFLFRKSHSLKIKEDNTWQHLTSKTKKGVRR